MIKLSVQKFEDHIIQEIQTVRHSGNCDLEDIAASYNNMFGMAALFKQILHAGMFVPALEDGTIIQEPESDASQEEKDQYEKAKARVLFADFNHLIEGDIEVITNGNLSVFTKTKHTGDQWLLPMDLKTVSDLAERNIFFIGSDQ